MKRKKVLRLRSKDGVIEKRTATAILNCEHRGVDDIHKLYYVGYRSYFTLATSLHHRKTDYSPRIIMLLKEHGFSYRKDNDKLGEHLIINKAAYKMLRKELVHYYKKTTK